MTRGADRPELPQDLADLPLRTGREGAENLSLFSDPLQAERDADALPAADSSPPSPDVGAPEDVGASEDVGAPENVGGTAEAAAAAGQLDLHDATERGPLRAEAGDRGPGASLGPTSEDAARRPAFTQLVLAAAADLVVHVGVLSLAVLAMAAMGLRPELHQWPGFAAFALLFSFLYVTIPLAFWGQTPGMAWSGVRARDADDRPLTFGQTALRWLASLVCLLLLGTPLLIALTGRSLADRLSRSLTIRAAPSA